MTGAARTRRLYTDGLTQPEGATESASALRVDEWRVPGAVHPLPVEPIAQSEAAHRADRTCEERALQAESRRRARAAMVSRMRAEEIDRRQNSPRQGDQAGTTQAVLEHYENSVEELRRLSRAPHDFEEELPSLRVVAPIILTANAADLRDERYGLAERKYAPW